jgi:hypothetical protein
MIPRQSKTAAFTIVLSVALATVAVLAALTTVAADKPMDPGAKAAWKITGQLEEACNCNAACPCWFNSKPSHMNCGGGQFLFIEKGSYGDVKLDGLAIGAMGQSPDGKGMMESFGNWNFNNYYIDEKGTPAQRDALKAIATNVLAGGASPHADIRITPITRTITGSEHKITMGTYGSFSGHLIEGGMGGNVTFMNPPGADPLHETYNQGLTTNLTYKDAGQNWNVEGSNYMYGTFTIDSAQYEKFAAGLAQKMKEMKK